MMPEMLVVGWKVCAGALIKRTSRVLDPLEYFENAWFCVFLITLINFGIRNGEWVDAIELLSCFSSKPYSGCKMVFAKSRPEDNVIILVSFKSD